MTSTSPETSTDGISEERVAAALEAHFRAQRYAETPEDNVPGFGPMRRALVAAGVPDLIRERDRLAGELAQAQRRIKRVSDLAAEDYSVGDDGEGGIERCTRVLYPKTIRAALHPDPTTED